mmetsp:Transcript_33928/g.81186  ORF Transcript_33928/g.81186 Transcript_33928/m.81186 type:complete len:233 (-) Transcript_33928:533-1231(-)
MSQVWSYCPPFVSSKNPNSSTRSLILLTSARRSVARASWISACSRSYSARTSCSCNLLALACSVRARSSARRRRSASSSRRSRSSRLRSLARLASISSLRLRNRARAYSTSDTVRSESTSDLDRSNCPHPRTLPSDVRMFLFSGTVYLSPASLLDLGISSRCSGEIRRSSPPFFDLFVSSPTRNVPLEPSQDRTRASSASARRPLSPPCWAPRRRRKAGQIRTPRTRGGPGG